MTLLHRVNDWFLKSELIITGRRPRCRTNVLTLGDDVSLKMSHARNMESGGKEKHRIFQNWSCLLWPPRKLIVKEYVSRVAGPPYKQHLKHDNWRNQWLLLITILIIRLNKEHDCCNATTSEEIMRRALLKTVAWVKICLMARYHSLLRTWI